MTKLFSIIKDFGYFVYYYQKYKHKYPTLQKADWLYKTAQIICFKEAKKKLNHERKTHQKDNDMTKAGMIMQELQLTTKNAQELELISIILNTIEHNQDLLLSRCAIQEETELELTPITSELESIIRNPDFTVKMNQILSYHLKFFVSSQLNVIIKSYDFKITKITEKAKYFSILIHFFPLKEVKMRRLGM